MTWRIEWHETTASTMDLARAALQTDPPPRVAIAALEQTAGRGRAGRTWTSPRGGLYVSLLVHNPPAALAPLLPLAAGLAVAETVSGFAPRLDVALKWPNDVVARGAADATYAKVAGVLTEGAARGAALAWAIIGIGLNLETPADALPDTGEIPAASLKTLGASPPPPRPALERLLARLDACLAAAEPERLATAASARLAYRGTKVRVTHKEQGDLVGRLRHVRADGHVVIQTGGGEVAVAPWDATLLRPA